MSLKIGHAERTLVAIVGRPNVGKSTLFNRLTGSRRAVVASVSGVTRDRHYGEVEWLDRSFDLVDTGGLDLGAREGLLPLLRAQTEVAIRDADVIVCVFDGVEGPTAADEEVVRWLRRSSKPVLWVANKADSARRESLLYEFARLGVDPVFAISAEHGRGIGELLDELLRRLPDSPPDRPRGEAEEEAGPIRIAVVGRPNVGKSSLVNRLLGADRVVVDERPGTTVDAVDTAFESGGKRYVLVDTAGLRRHRASAGDVERVGAVMALKSLARCDVALLLLDAVEGLTTGDAHVAGLAEERGAGVLTLLNKWDLVRTDREGKVKSVREAISRRIPWMKGAPILTVSALTGEGIGRILSAVESLHELCTQEVATSRLNRCVGRAIEATAPPSPQGHRVRIFYAAQVASRPPTFIVFTSRPRLIPVSYKRFLENRVREEFGMNGVPIRLLFRARPRREGRRTAPSERAEESIEREVTDGGGEN